MEDKSVESVDSLSSKIRINVWITRTQYEAFNTLSSMDNRSLSDLVREAFRDYLETHKERLNGGH